MTTPTTKAISAPVIAHTPGPWTTHDTGFPNPNGQNFVVLDTEHHVIVQVSDAWNMPAEPNARLIATAPELLAIVKEMLDPGAMGRDIAERARAAIAKAEGTA